MILGNNHSVMTSAHTHLSSERERQLRDYVTDLCNNPEETPFKNVEKLVQVMTVSNDLNALHQSKVS